MSITLKEAYQSQEGQYGSNGYLYWVYIVKGSDYVVDVISFLVPQLNATVDAGEQTYVFDNFRPKYLAPELYEVTVTYRSPTGTRATGDAAFQFSTGGSTQHIQSALATIQTAAAPGRTAENYYGAINVTTRHGQSTVGGMDVTVPAFEFRTVYYISPASMTTSFIDLLYRSTGKVNSDVVNLSVDGVAETFQPGELLMRGAEGSKRIGFGDWELTINWAAIPNVANATVGAITGINAKGWERIDVKYTDDVSDTGLSMIPRPIQVDVLQIFPYAPLSGITPPPSEPFIGA